MVGASIRRDAGRAEPGWGAVSCLTEHQNDEETMRALTTIAAAAALCAGATALPGAAQAASANACFNTQQIQNTVRVSQREINLRTVDGRYFRITTKNSCSSPNLTDPLVIKAGGGSGLVCRPVDLSLSSGLDPNVACLVDTITLLDPAQVAALPAKAKP